MAAFYQRLPARADGHLLTSRGTFARGSSRDRTSDFVLLRYMFAHNSETYEVLASPGSLGDSNGQTVFDHCYSPITLNGAAC